MKPDTLVIVNPASGGGRALRAEAEVASLLAARGCRAAFVHSKSAEDIREQAARAAGLGFRNVVRREVMARFIIWWRAFAERMWSRDFFRRGTETTLHALWGFPAIR